ncbi:hypothetical protein ACVTKY_003241 [Klebsiella michiganensis]
MTTITREQLIKKAQEQISFCRDTKVTGEGRAHVDQCAALFEIALAAIDSEPVAWLWSRDGDDERDVSLTPPEVDDDAADAIECGWTATPLYRHAQPAPVVPENCVTVEHRRVIEMLLNVCGAAFELADDSCQQDVDGEDCHVVPDDAFQKLSDALDEIENTLPTEDIDRPDVFLAWSAIPKAALKSLIQAGNSPVTGIDLASGPDRTVEVRYVAPPGYVMVPMRLTAENGAKGALSGEFSETKFVNCPECFGDDECETCDGSGRIEITVPVTWTTIKEIWDKGVEHFAAAPQEVQVVSEKIEQSRKKIDRCDVCTEGARGGCGTCIFNGNFE